ncbi:mucin-5AC-like [Bactrocera tryoni]|uniref:mucin-5AC-like n=1 Tax=Bactrocera tryoni TaxID=59916 RepID=UPI001A9784DF|nr:mucin-5AC-like [Bactrocera tryoni]
MLRIIQISIVFLFVIIGTTRAQTTEAPLFPKCLGGICFCSPGTHEALYNGRKYCAPDNTDNCPEHAVRLSAQVCECKKGYRFRNEDREECVSEHIGGEPVPPPVDDGDDELIEKEIPTTKVEMPTTTPTTTQSTTTTTTESATTTTTTPLPTNVTTPATTITTTSTNANTTSLEESETRSNTLYIYIGIGVMAIAALLLIVILYILRKQ